MNNYDVFLFDWDGTMTASLELSFEILRTQYGRYGLTPTDAEIAKHFGDHRSAVHFGLDESRLTQFNKELQGIFRERMPSVPLYPDAQRVLSTLKGKGKKTALITSALREVVDASLAHHEVVEMFDVVIALEDVAEPKPHPEGILAALDRFEVSKNRAIMLGDSHKDLEAAKNAGVDSLLFYPPAHKLVFDEAILKKYQPTYTIISWRELLDRLQ